MHPAKNPVCLSKEGNKGIRNDRLVLLGSHNKKVLTGWLKQQKLFSHSSGGWNSMSDVLGGWFLLRSPRPADSCFLLTCPHTLISLCLLATCVSHLLKRVPVMSD